MDSVHKIDRKAFRLCIHRDDCDLLLDPTKWPVSEWFFKSPQATATATAAATAPALDVGDFNSQNVEQRGDQLSHIAESSSAARSADADDVGVDDVDHHIEDMEATILTPVGPSDQVVTVSNDGST